MRAPGAVTIEESEILHQAFDILEAFGMSASAGLAELREMAYEPETEAECLIVRNLRQAESSSATACIAIEEVLDIAQA